MNPIFAIFIVIAVVLIGGSAVAVILLSRKRRDNDTLQFTNAATGEPLPDDVPTPVADIQPIVQPSLQPDAPIIFDMPPGRSLTVPADATPKSAIDPAESVIVKTAAKPKPKKRKGNRRR